MTASATARLRFGATYPTLDLGTDPGVLREWAQGVEEIGYDEIFIPEHVVGIDASQHPEWRPLNPLTLEHDRPLYDYQNPFFEPLVTFGFLAAVTSRVRLVSGVLVAPQRQAVLVAKQAAIADILSGGRVTLGVGAGWNDAEFSALGADYRGRGRKLDEQLEVLRLLWTNDTVTFRGAFHTLDAAGIAPPPIQRPIPILIGGDSDAALARAARHGDGWFTTGSIDAIAPRFERYESLLVSAGRSAEDAVLICTISAAGSEADIVGELQAWVDAGARGVNVRTAVYPVSVEGRADVVRVTDPSEHVARLERVRTTWLQTLPSRRSVAAGES